MTGRNGRNASHHPTIGSFLFEYLYDRGARHVFGIPGDFALPTFRWLERSKLKLITMTHEHANWRNSDLSIDQVESRIAGAGGDANELFSTLDGSSIGAGLAKMLFGLMKMMPSMQLMGKVAMMEMLGRADELIDSVPGMEHMMDVIIKDRNEVVMDDLARIIEKEKDIKTVGIIYGGGHMPDLEKHLAEMGYHEQSVQWLDAISVDLPKNKADAAQLETMREMVRSALDEQVKQAKKTKKKAE